MGRSICYNQVFCSLFYFLYYCVCFQVNYSSSLSSFSSSSPNTSTHSLCPQKQSLALLQFKSAVAADSKPIWLYNSSRKTDSWKESSDCCSWDGVTCNKVTGNVIGLDLNCSGLHGTIDDNNSLFHLLHLQWLNLAHNNLSGTVKFDILSKLKNLEKLDLSNNCLLGFSSTSNMNYSLPNLEDLNFSFCNVGEFPMFLRTSERLSKLDLSNNRITGRILKTMSKGWKSLIDLDLSNNFLTYIEHHPWKNIQLLKLQNNKIQGSILVPPLSTKVFLLSTNKLSGQIPPSICTLSSLQYLSLSKNNLSGIIPSCLGNSMVGLIMLHLQKNNLQGGIPDTFSNGIQLRSLYLNNNKLEGALPRSLANCSRLEIVNIGYNMMSDTFPCWLGNLLELKVLVMRSNRFYGSLCDDKSISNFDNLQIIDLSLNEFSGFLPRRFFAHMKKMMDANKFKSGNRYYMGGDYYYDYVNVAMKGREYRLGKIFPTFTSIDLSRNQFQGEILEVLENLKSLMVINLSHNKLTGNIPVYLANLTTLESLDLSFNKFEGRIPDQLASVTTLSALNLSYNQLSGLIPQGKQFNTFENDSFIGNKGLCGKPLSVICDYDGAATQPPSSSVLNEEDEIAFGFDWKFAMAGYASGVVTGVSMGYIVFSTGKPHWLVRMVEEQLIKKGRKSRLI